MKIVLIGAGNLATGLSVEMYRVGMTISQVYSRTEESASALASQLGCEWTTDLHDIIPDADLYIFSVSDSALPEVIHAVKPNDGLWVHTAGSVPMDIFKGHIRRYGVFYPLQTFSKDRRILLDDTYIFLEVAQPEDETIVKKVAKALSAHVQLLSSKKRKTLHLAAVFACNFVNSMYVQATKLVEEQGIKREVLLPLIMETAKKVEDMPPKEAQTGPAVRNDTAVMDRHVSMLKEPALQELYKLMSKIIYEEKSRS